MSCGAGPRACLCGRGREKASTEACLGQAHRNAATTTLQGQMPLLLPRQRGTAPLNKRVPRQTGEYLKQDLYFF